MLLLLIAAASPIPARFIMVCEEEAPPVLATRWRTVRADTLNLRYVMAASERVRDRRIYERLHEVVLDRSRPDVVRVGAMIVLMKFLEPSNAYSFADLAPPPGHIQVIRLRSASTTHPVQTPGPVPLGEPVGRPVLELLERIAAERETESRPVWYAAAVLAKTLAFDLRHGSAQ
jgi:hypothetical protein